MTAKGEGVVRLNVDQIYIRRANYQARVWKASLTACPAGGKVVDGKLAVDWISEAPAPKYVLALVACGCRTDCSTRRCQCRAHGLVCTDACSCVKTCTNCENDVDDDDEEENDDL